MAMVIERSLTADQQIESMRASYPGFSVVHATPWIVNWHGDVTPLARTYRIQILYSAISMPLASIEAFTPHVEVLEPLLSRRPECPEEPIPHQFRNRAMPTQPRLCLYRGSEWTRAQLIADTIVPWTIEWLVAYEGWRATGTWYAGGHHTERAR